MKIGVWTGNETFGEVMGALFSIGDTIKAMGADSWFIKVSDGGNQWIMPEQGHEIESTTGVKLYPWIYSYGAIYKDFEKPVVQRWVQAGFPVSLDVEDQWFGEVYKGYKDIHLFGVTSYANPRDLGKGQLWNNLSNSFTCDYFLPQVYTPYDAMVFKLQYQGFRLSPIINKDTIASCRGYASASIWEYRTATVAMVNTMNGLLIPPAPGDPKFMEQQFNDGWKATGYTSGTGIYHDVLSHYLAGIIIGWPESAEFTTVDWTGIPVTMQFFSDGYVCWYGDHSRGYAYVPGKVAMQVW